jgi:sulfide dehydrogenase cytochrome subunit
MTPKLLATTAAVMAALGAGAPALAQDANALRTRALAATCAHCHGTDGRAVGGEGTRLAGLPKDHLVSLLNAFRSGQRPATVMHQISKGYTPEQLDEIAAYFAAQR